MLDLKSKYGDRRRTEIRSAEGEFSVEDLIADEDMVITMSHAGYIKRSAVSEYRSQGRGGRGVLGMDSKDGDFVEQLFVASAHTYILFFTNAGRCYWLKVYRIPEASRQSRGKPIINLLSLRPDERIAAFVTVKEFDESHFILTVTERGIVNKQPLIAYANVRRDGINAVSLDEGDRMIECKLTSGDNDVILGTAEGQAVRFHESAVRELGRNTRGVRGITLRGSDHVVSMIIVDESKQVLTVTENGFGKRTPVTEYRKTNRGGSGIINIKESERNGAVVGLKGVTDDVDIMLITKKGIIIRCDVTRISIIGRNTQGVRLINLEEGDKVVDITVCDKQPQLDEEQSGAGAGNSVEGTSASSSGTTDDAGDNGLQPTANDATDEEVNPSVPDDPATA
jgi:DNA gyrase subunit A